MLDRMTWSMGEKWWTGTIFFLLLRSLLQPVPPPTVAPPPLPECSPSPPPPSPPSSSPLPAAGEDADRLCWLPSAAPCCHMSGQPLRRRRPCSPASVRPPPLHWMTPPPPLHTTPVVRHRFPPPVASPPPANFLAADQAAHRLLRCRSRAPSHARQPLKRARTELPPVPLTPGTPCSSPPATCDPTSAVDRRLPKGRCPCCKPAAHASHDCSFYSARGQSQPSRVFFCHECCCSVPPAVTAFCCSSCAAERHLLLLLLRRSLRRAFAHARDATLFPLCNSMASYRYKRLAAVQPDDAAPVLTSPSFSHG